MKKFSIFLAIFITLSSLITYASWYYYFGYLVGKDAREATDILKLRGHKVIHPTTRTYPGNHNEIYEACNTVEDIAFLNNGIHIVTVFDVSDQCIVKRVYHKFVW